MATDKEMPYRIKLFNRHISLTVWESLSDEERIKLLSAIEKDNDELREYYRRKEHGDI